MTSGAALIYIISGL